MNAYTNADIAKHDPALLGKLVGPQPPDGFVSNGCSCSPDEIGPVVIWPACHFHDYHYRDLGVSSQLRTQADRWLYLNLLECGASKVTALAYWLFVRAWGFRHYEWRAGFRPNAYERLVLFVRSLVRF